MRLQILCAAVFLIAFFLDLLILGDLVTATIGGFCAVAGFLFLAKREGVYE